MAKQFTVEEIANYIINSDIPMYEDGLYFAHVTRDGELVERCADADETFTAPFDASEWEDDEDPVRFYKEAETLDNEDFRRVCEDLSYQLDKYMEEVEAEGEE